MNNYNFQIGNIKFNLIKDGNIFLDGGSMFGSVPKVLWQKYMVSMENNTLQLALNCLLVITPEYKILIETGAGTKLNQKQRKLYGLSESSLLYNLSEAGINKEDIDYVLLTHLDFDHAGGCTLINENQKLVPAFPNAIYVIQQSEWNAANNVDDRSKYRYFKEDFLPLAEYGRLKLIDGTDEILPDITAIYTGGHTNGHQIFLINCNEDEKIVAFMGDIIPTCAHVNPQWITAFDHYPVTTVKQKKKILTQAIKENWLIVMVHEENKPLGYITEKDGKYALLTEMQND